MEQQEGKHPFLELIPNERLSYEQHDLRPVNCGGLIPIYQLLRTPTHLSDILVKGTHDRYEKIGIWRNNQTLICTEDFGALGTRHCKFTVDDVRCAIYGDSSATIVDTFSFFCSLKSLGGEKASLIIGSPNCTWHNFDYYPLRLTPILDANPIRSIELNTGIWTAEQSVVLATRPYPLNLKLCRPTFAFKDKGTAFVNALERRQFPFGSLSMTLYKDDDTPVSFSHTNLKRLFQLDVFENLKITISDKESVLLPLSARVNALECEIDAKHVQARHFDSLDIVTKDLNVTINLDDVDNWSAVLISFLNRVATLGHFERLSFSVGGWDDDREPIEHDEVQPVAEALIRVIHANPKLKHMDLSDKCNWNLDWIPHMQNIFKALEEHDSLRTLVVKEIFSHDYTMTEEDRQRYYSWLEDFLSRSHYISVVDRGGRRCSNGSSIDKIYRNRYHHLSAKLVKESETLRALLVGKALLESASNNFLHTVHLLSNHRAILCDLIENVQPDESVESPSAQADLEPPPSPPAAQGSSQTDGDSTKRKSTSQPSDAVTKQARNET